MIAAYHLHSVYEWAFCGMPLMHKMVTSGSVYDLYFKEAGIQRRTLE